MTISVALCTYNGEKFLHAQLDSILNQSVLVNEIVVCDDGSTDGTKEILTQYQNRYPKIFKLHFNEQNLGYVRNFEKAITLCTGDLIFLSDQDDIWLEEKVEVMKNNAINHPDKNVFAHKIEILSVENSILPVSFWDKGGFSLEFSNPQILEFLLFERNVFPGMSMVLTQKAVQRYLPLQNPDRIMIHDYEIAIKSCKENTFLCVQEVLTHYRMHDNQNIGFDTSLEQVTETINSIYGKIKRLKLIVNWCSIFQLDTNFIEKYKNKCRKDYNIFIVHLPFLIRWITHFKIKYYYKILHELS